MAYSDLFHSGEHLRNVNHFAAIVNLASVDGEINEQEKIVVDRFAHKLDITEQEYKTIVENPQEFPISAYNNEEKRLEHLHDLFKIIFADNIIDKEEEELIKRYSIGLGFSSEISEKIIKRSIEIFSGQLDFDDYLYLLKKNA